MSPLSTVDLSVNYTGDIGNNVTIRYYDSSDDSLIDTDYNIPDGGTSSITWGPLDNLNTYSWYAKIDNGLGNVTTDTWNFNTIYGDVSPVMNTVRLYPSGSQKSNVTFDVEVNGSIPSGENITYEIRFFRNGATVPSLKIDETANHTENLVWNVTTIPSTETIVGDEWKVEARACEIGDDCSSYMASNTVSIENTPPIMINSTITSGYEV